MLDVIVLIAMTVIAAAFAVGLVAEAGLPQIPAVIAAAALYMVMAASYLILSRSSKSAGGSDRLDDLEAALEVIDKDLQRIDKVEDDVSRLDQAVGDGGGERGGGLSHLAQVAQEIEDVHAKIETLRNDLEGEARDQRAKITSDLRGLETLIKQLSADLVSAPADALAASEEEDAAAAEPETLADVERAEREPQAEDIVFEAETITVTVEEEAEDEEPASEAGPVGIASAEEEEFVRVTEMEAAPAEDAEEKETAPEADPMAALIEEAEEEPPRAERSWGSFEQQEETPLEPETAVAEEEFARETEMAAMPIEPEETAPETETVPAEDLEETVREAEIAAEEPAPEAEPVMTAAAEEEEELVLSEEASAGFIPMSAPETSTAAETPSGQELPEASGVADMGDSEMLEIISQAIEAGRIELYLQPTVTLPERRLCYLEAFTRIRTDSDSLIRPRSYLPAAEASGMMPLIDNVLLVKSVQTLRRLGPGSRVKGIFCNISVSTLLDPEFFPELVEFMEENSGLSDRLVFEISHSALSGLGQTELGALDTLAALGYGFSLDHVAGFDLDFVGLRDRSFRFVKFDARTFLSGNGGEGGDFSVADMMRALDDFDIKLIVEKVADEDAVAALLDRGITLAQGYLFGGPKPLGPALLSEIEN